MIQCLSRKNTLSRKVSGTQLKEQVIASNIDLLCICLSMRGNIRPSVIGRYLFVLSGNYRQLLLLTQKDLCPDSDAKLNQIRCAFPHTEIASVFGIFYELAKECKFSNCTHTVEPHCRIQEALHLGEISLEEYKQFIKLEHEKQRLSKAQPFHFQKYKK